MTKRIDTLIQDIKSLLPPPVSEEHVDLNSQLKIEGLWDGSAIHDSD